MSMVIYETDIHLHLIMFLRQYKMLISSLNWFENIPMWGTFPEYAELCRVMQKCVSFSVFKSTNLGMLYAAFIVILKTVLLSLFYLILLLQYSLLIQHLIPHEQDRYCLHKRIYYPLSFSEMHLL